MSSLIKWIHTLGAVLVFAIVAPSTSFAVGDPNAGDPLIDSICSQCHNLQWSDGQTEPWPPAPIFGAFPVPRDRDFATWVGQTIVRMKSYEEGPLCSQFGSGNCDSPANQQEIEDIACAVMLRNANHGGIHPACSNDGPNCGFAPPAPIDDDNDGIYNSCDLCPNTPATTSVDETGCPITSSINEDKKLTNNGNTAAAAISGNTIVIGAVSDGAAYVFERNAGGTGNWGEVKKITTSNAAPDDRFGGAVAISNDTLVVGAIMDDDAGQNSGAIYVFERNSGGPGNWGEVKKLTASDAAPEDWFGSTVAINGDTVVVGGGIRSGAVYVFNRNAGGIGNWGEVKKLTASDAKFGDFFGRSVAISGDTVVIGAPWNDDAGNVSGSAYVFERNAGGVENWGEVTKLNASDAAAEEWFGYSVAISGDSVVVGAYLSDDVGFNIGAAYMFERNAGGAANWGEVKKLTASDADNGDEFGFSVAVSDKIVVVSAPRDDDIGSNSGSAYIFEQNTGGVTNWGEVKKLTASDAAANDSFGIVAAVDGNTVVVGAGFRAGAAYVFDLQASAEQNVQVFCGLCHGLIANGVRVTDHIPNKSEACMTANELFDKAPCGTKNNVGDVEKWQGVIEKMRDKNGAPVPDDDATVSAMAEYLASFGKDKDKETQ